ncbi:uncharacterized protein [Chiloscyllium punctatum]|uniref:Uncharacterized protein n=1 Tax=Chiloscyllium punctatum TaxID=137246 RepID=A0A401SDD1_CHIPU|nr:hypothetical protein [Chiloscyllium punctatum]
MSFWCGVLVAVTTAFSLNVLYHDLFVTEPGGDAIPKSSFLDPLYPPSGNWVTPKDPKSLDFISSPEFKLHQPFTALLPAKQSIEIQFEVPEEEETPENDEEPLSETGLTVIQTDLSVIPTEPPVKSTKQVVFDIVDIVELETDLEEDYQDDIIITDELLGETLQTCPAKDGAAVNTEVKQEVEIPVSEVISLGEQNDISIKEENITTEEEIQKKVPTPDPVQSHRQNHLERDVFLLLGVHLALVISVLIMGCRCLCAHKLHVSNTVDVEELVVTIGLISCIVVALFALLGATIILFIRILLAKFP